MATKSNADHGAEIDELRTGILLMLAEEPFSGYDLINEAMDRSNGHWHLTAAKIHPMLDTLTDEGLVQLSEVTGVGRQRPYELTPAGRTFVETDLKNVTPPWLAYAPYALPQQGQQSAPDAISVQFQEVVREFTAAATQVAQVGTQEQQDQARKFLTEGKRGLYRILADDAPGSLNQ